MSRQSDSHAHLQGYARFTDRNYHKALGANESIANPLRFRKPDTEQMRSYVSASVATRDEEEYSEFDFT